MKMQQVEGGRQGSSRRRKPAGADAGPVKAEGTASSPEIELKFQVPELAREALGQALKGLKSRTSRLRARYFDTDDGRLAEAGISLRLRQVDRQWFQTLKVAGKGGIYEREEHEVEIPGAADGIFPELDLSRHHGTPAGDALRKFMKEAGQPGLEERYATEVTRRAWDLAQGAARVEAALDEGRVLADGREEAFCELELELKTGEAKDLCALARDWAGRYGLWLSSESKSARGERLLKGSPMPVVKASPPRLDQDMGGDAALRAIARCCIDQILPNAAAVAAGSRDHDHVHQLRVGLRRLRTVMRELGDLSHELDRDWEAPLADAFRQLGEYRDREAVLENLKPKLLKAGAAGIGWMETPGEGADPVATARAPEFQAALLDVLGFALGRGEGNAGKDFPRYLRRRLKSLHRRVADDGMRFKDLSEPAQHQVRKRLKRLRYMSEFVSPLFGRRGVDAYLDSLRPAQDALGEHNDYAVAGEMARQAAARGDGDAAFALQWLEKQQKQSVKSSRKALRKIDEAPRFWKRSQAAH